MPTITGWEKWEVSLISLFTFSLVFFPFNFARWEVQEMGVGWLYALQMYLTSLPVWSKGVKTLNYMFRVFYHKKIMEGKTGWHGWRDGSLVKSTGRSFVDLGWSPSTTWWFIITCNSRSGDTTPLSDLWGHGTRVVHRHMESKYQHTFFRQILV